MYKLSIIIPIYKVEAHIKECINSVLCQLPSNVEIICINDGTPDNSMQILKEVVGTTEVAIQNQFQLIDQENKGLSGARNTGINHARGEYIGFLDSDDKLCPTYFDTILNILNKDEEYDILDFNLITSTGKIFKSGDGDLNSTFSLMNWFSPARVYNRSLFKSNRFTLGIYYEDIDLTPRLYIEANKIYHVDKALYWYRYNEQSITRSTNSSSNIKIINSLELTLNKYLDLYRKNNNKYYVAIIIQCFYLLCTAATRRFGVIKGLTYVKKYSRQTKEIDTKSLPLNKQLVDKKMIAFFTSPKAYILFYSAYLKLSSLK